MSEERKHLFRLPIARIIKEIYEEKSLERRDIALHLDCVIRKIKLIEIQENYHDVYSKEQAESLVEFLGIKKVRLDEADFKQYKKCLYEWRKQINQGKLGSAAKILEEHSLHEITYLPFEHSLIMLYKMFDAKFAMAQRKYDLAEQILGKIEIRSLSRETRYHYYYNLGALHIYNKSYDLALKFFTKAYETGFVDEEDYQYALHFNLGLCYSYLGMCLRAIVCYEKADLLFNRKDNNHLSMNLDNSLGIEYIRAGQIKLAKKRLSEVVLNAQACESKVYGRRAMNNLGYLNFKEKDYIRALDYFDRALLLTEEGEEEYLLNLYYKVLCLIVTENFLARIELSYAANIAKNNDNQYYLMLFKSLSHLLDLKKETSSEYIESRFIPYLMNRHEYYRARDYYEIMKDFFEKNGNKAKAQEMKSSSDEIYIKIMQGGGKYEKKIDWPDFNLSYNN